MAATPPSSPAHKRSHSAEDCEGVKRVAQEDESEDEVLLCEFCKAPQTNPKSVSGVREFATIEDRDAIYICKKCNQTPEACCLACGYRLLDELNGVSYINGVLIPDPADDTNTRVIIDTRRRGYYHLACVAFAKHSVQCTCMLTTFNDDVRKREFCRGYLCNTCHNNTESHIFGLECVFDATCKGCKEDVYKCEGLKNCQRVFLGKRPVLPAAIRKALTKKDED
jgi:hypothetical protein